MIEDKYNVSFHVGPWAYDEDGPDWSWPQWFMGKTESLGAAGEYLREDQLGRNLQEIKLLAESLGGRMVMSTQQHSPRGGQGLSLHFSFGDEYDRAGFMEEVWNRGMKPYRIGFN